jgi:hypothetical protein
MSAALLDLSTRLGEVRLLTSLDPSRAGDVTKPDESNALTRACILLLSAHLEGYLEDLVTEALDLLVHHATLVDDLPLLLRAIHVEEHLRRIEVMQDRNARAPRISAMLAAETPLWIAGNKLRAGMLRPKMVCSEMNNPGSREICQFLRFIGIDVEAYLTSVGNLPVLNQVNGLVGRRNAIAHGDASTTAAYSDIDQYLIVVGDLSRELDAAVAQQLQSICRLPTLPW